MGAFFHHLPIMFFEKCAILKTYQILGGAQWMKKFTKAGTNIEEVKRQNALAGNGKSIKEELGEEIFSQSVSKTAAGTNIQKVKEEIAEESNMFSVKSNARKTKAGTDIQKVKEEIAKESSNNNR